VEPHRTLFIGDHPEIDIVGATRAGMLTAWLHHGRSWPDILRPLVPDYVINELSDLAALLRVGRAESNDVFPNL
jgi:FMN phosphatase YigB (HAD superfamily)